VVGKKRLYVQISATSDIKTPGIGGICQRPQTTEIKRGIFPQGGTIKKKKGPLSE